MSLPMMGQFQMVIKLRVYYSLCHRERCEEKSSEDFFRDKELKMSNYWSYNPDKWWKVLIPWSFSGIQQAHPLLLMVHNTAHSHFF